MQQISPVLQSKIQEQQYPNKNQQTDITRVDLSTKPDTLELSNKNNDEKKSKTGKIIAIGAAIAAVITAGVLLIKHKLSTDKAKRLAQEAAKNAEIDKIFKDVKTVQDKLTGEKISFDELMQRYLHDYDMTGKTLYHGTGLETAEIIKNEGINESIRGSFLGKFDGAYFSEKLETAQRYAQQAARQGKTVQGMFMKPINVSAGAIVQASLPEGTKLAQFTNNEGKFITCDLLEDIFNAPEMTTAMENAKLQKTDIIKRIQDLLVKKGYDGIRNYEVHTGATPIIFNRNKLQYGDIIKI